MVDILLIQPPIADYYHTAKRTIPYGLAAIAAVVRQHGFTVDILDALATQKSRIVAPPAALSHLSRYYGREDRSPFALFHHFRHYGYSLAHIQRQAAASGAFLVGIASSFSAYSDMALAVARAVKAGLPGCTVVLGGHHPTALPEAVMAEPAVDLVIRGEGEDAFAELAAALHRRRPIGDVPGIVYRNPDGTLTISPPTHCRDADHLPAPALDLVRRSFYARRGLDSIVVTASRGCPLACSYCATGARSWMGFRRRSVSAVLDEVRMAGEGRRIGFIDFEDENLTMDRHWFLDLLAGIGEIFASSPPELRAMNGLYPPTLSAEVVRCMAAHGFRTLNLSLGSADRRQQKRFNRPDVSGAFDEALTAARREGLAAVGYIIVGAPDQDPMTSLDDLLFLARRPVLAGVSVFYPAPGSEDYRRCDEQGLLPAAFAAMRSTALPIDQRSSRTDAVTLLRLGRLLNFIKYIAGAGRPLPPAAPIEERIDSSLDRVVVGGRLLAAFLYDGRLRGVDGDGRVYPHRVAEGLCRRFLDGITAHPVVAGCDGAATGAGIRSGR